MKTPPRAPINPLWVIVLAVGVLAALTIYEAAAPTVRELREWWRARR